MARLAALAQRAALSAFGEPAVVEIDGQPVSVVGLFHAAHAALEIVQDAPVSTVRPVLTVREADVPQRPAEGDRVMAAGRVYRIVDAQPDGLGMITLVLQEA